MAVMSSLLPACLVPQRPPPAAIRVQGPAAPEGAAPQSQSQSQPPPLRQAAANTKRHIGTALVTWHFDDAQYKAVAAREFDSLTPENEMKWDAVEPAPDHFSFRAGDTLVAFGLENAMRVRGHTLVWHSQLPGWVKSLSGDPLREAMNRHVKTVVDHWKGKIAQWDVVNEALADGGELRSESPFSSLGPQYIDAAFRAAHEADPNALLYLQRLRDRR
jgi:endo-1,4-beta-xylanase